MSKYQYKPLDTKKQEIRLLHLLPGSSTDDLRLHVVYVPFSEAKKLKYEALSYTWGSEDNLQPILISRLSRPNVLSRIRRAVKDVAMVDEVDSGVLFVTPNLAAALRHLRKPNLPLRLWVDAICIDQGNADEKAIEVNRMGDIYRHAGSVLVWLGPESEDSVLAMDTLYLLAHHVKDFGDDSTWQFVINRQDEPYPWAGNSTDEYNARRAAVGNLLQRPWFRRLWIWQEIILTTSAIMICGNATLPYSDFRRAILMALGDLPHGESLQDCFEGNFKTHIRRMLMMPRRSPILPVLLYHTKDAMCKDPRDRIYALKSLLPQDIQADIKPDYTKTVEEVFKDAVSSCITINKSLELLTHCEMPFPPSWTSSWIPNLGSPKTTSSFNFGFASGHSMPEVQYRGEHTLLVQGVHASSIAEILCVFTQEATSKEIIPALQELARKLLLELLTEEEKAAMATSFISLVTCYHSAIEDIDKEGSTTPELFRKDLVILANANLASSSLEVLSKLDLIVAALLNCPGRAIFKTTEGFMGLGPAALEVGDHICALLGCATPLILRPVANHSDEYEVVGQTFIREFMDKQAFLGPIPHSLISWVTIHRDEAIFTYLYDGIATEEDPRLGPLPRELRIYTEDYTSMEPLIDFETLPRIRERFRRPKMYPYDPRLTSKQLRARGVNIKTLSLV